MTIRSRLLLTLAPLVILLAALGGAGVGLLYWLGGRIDAILSENYRSVVYMVDLNEALERVDSSFNFALIGQEQRAREMYAENWRAYEENLGKEQNNITVPGEGELVDRLAALTAHYREEGDRFYAAPAGAGRSEMYLGAPGRPGLSQRFGEIKKVATAVRDLNQENMVQASADARRQGAAARLWLAGGLAVTTLLAGWLAWNTLRAILRPLRELTDSALAVGAGNLSRVVSAADADELGGLARAFNRMTGQLRDYRQTASARLLRAQRTGQATIDSFPDPVLVVEPGGGVEMANPAARRVLGIAPPEPSRGGGAAAVPWQPPEPLRAPLAEAVRGQRATLAQAFDQAITFRLDGEDRAYLPQVLPISDPYGNTLGAAVVLNDVTRFRLLDQIKTDLVATVSHELKTPLTGVRLALHLLLEETVGPLTPKQTELLVDARDNAERLLNMIEHLLALARLEGGRAGVALRPVAPQALLDAAADAVRPRAADKHVAFTAAPAPGLPDVAADPERLGHALNNLLDNALTYTEGGGRVTLAARPVEGGVEFEVADTGVGIAPEHLPHVFEKFFRVPGQSRGQGTGLGLAIVREIAAAHHGRAAAESEPGRGTVFRLTVPTWEARQAGRG